MALSKFKTVGVKIFGPTDQSRSVPFNSQRTLNLFPEVNPEGRSTGALHSFPGAKSWSSGSDSEPDRGLYLMGNFAYKLSGTNLYKVDSLGAQTNIGTISGTGRAIFADNGGILVIVASGNVYTYDGTTFVAAAAGLFQTPNSVAQINNQYIYDGDADGWQMSNVGAPTTFNGANYAFAESQGDDLKRAYSFNQLVYFFGDKSIEPWYDSGDGNPPFNRIDGAIMEIGLEATYSLANNEKAMYFLGSDRKIHRIVGQSESSVTPEWLHYKLSNFTTVSDAIGFCFTIYGQNFYCINFIAENKTYCYSETTEFWFDLACGVTEDAHYASSYIYAFGKHLIADRRNGNIYEWDFLTYTDNGTTIVRERTLQVINSTPLDAPGQRIQMSRFKLLVENGVGLITGQGENPQIMLTPSFDGGRTWGSEVTLNVGRMGEWSKVVEWYSLQSFYDLVIKLRMTDPVFWSLQDASIDIRLAGY